MIGQTILQHEVVERLGGGGMGIVYKAFDRKLDRFVALKFLPAELSRDEDANERFIQEARAVTALDHPNICRVHDIQETDDGRLFIVMAFYEGRTLKYRLNNDPPDTASTLAIATAIASGLDASHKKGIIHRDIKPANVMITDDGEVKILDFGLARLSGALGLTGTGKTVGTSYYMAPEQLSGTDVDERADIWSLGVVLYEMLTGARPFDGEYDQAVGYAVINTDPKFGTIEDAGARAIVETCLRKDPSERFGSATELADALEALSAGSFSGSSLPRPHLQHKRIAVLMTALILALAAAASWIFFPEPTDVSATPPERQTLVVLPFENLGDADYQYFADGMAEELNTRLASVQSLRLISRNTANRYRSSGKTAPEIGAELGVDYVIGGSVRGAGLPDGSRRVRVAPYLTRVSDDLQVWAEAYDHALADILDVQSDVAIRVVESLRAVLRPEEAEILEARLTDNPDAYLEYLKGLHLARTWRGPGSSLFADSTALADAFAHFARALELDSLFVDAALRVTQSAGSLVFRGYWRPVRNIPEHYAVAARDAARRVARLSPGSRADLLAGGYYNYFVVRDYAAALALFSRALEISEDSEVLYAVGSIHRRLGNLEFALDYFDRSLALDPHHVALWNEALVLLHHLRRFPQYLEYQARAVALDSSSFNYCSLNTGITSVMLRADLTTDRARRTLAGAPGPEIHCDYLDFYDRKFQVIIDRHESGQPVWEPYVWESYRRLGHPDLARQVWVDVRESLGSWENRFGWLAVAEAGLGNRDAALEALEAHEHQFREDVAFTFDQFNTFAFNTYVMLDMLDEAFDVLDVEASRPGWMNEAWLRMPFFDEIREEPRFQAALRKFVAWETPWRQ